MFFSANENLALRQHKRRIIEYVEETMPESALDAGTNVMVMQVSCRDPGCVPLETAIAIVFPRPISSKKKKSKKKPKELIEGLEESANGGTFKTKILLPMSEVTKDDVLEALPPEFKGGRRTMEKLCLRARDVMLSQITQIMGNEKQDEDGRKLMAVYLKECLDDYIARGCVPAPFGEAFPPLVDEKEKEAPKTVNGDDADATSTEPTTKAPAKVVADQNTTENKSNSDGTPNKKTVANETSASEAAETVSRGMAGKGNFVFRRVLDDDDEDDTNDRKKDESKISSKLSSSASTTNTSATSTTTTKKVTAATSITSAMDWRRRQNTQNIISSSEKTTIQKLAEREHAPGVRRPGCPCCDIDNPSNVVDEMLML